MSSKLNESKGTGRLLSERFLNFNSHRPKVSSLSWGKKRRAKNKNKVHVGNRGKRSLRSRNRERKHRGKVSFAEGRIILFSRPWFIGSRSIERSIDRASGLIDAHRYVPNDDASRPIYHSSALCDSVHQCNDSTLRYVWKELMNVTPFSFRPSWRVAMKRGDAEWC